MAAGVPALHPEEKGTLNVSPRANYIEKRGGLPPYINSVAVALVRKGMPRSRAIATAVNVIKKTCATGLWGGRPGENVSPAVRAAACSAAARWEAIKTTSTSIPTRERRLLELAFDRLEREAVDLSNIDIEGIELADAGRPSLVFRDCSFIRPRKRRFRDLIRRAIFADHLLEFAPSTAEREAARKKGQAMAGKNGGAPRFPIRNRSDLDKAIRAVGRARPKTAEERAKVRRFIRRRAQTLGAMDMIPDNWQADGSLK